MDKGPRAREKMALVFLAVCDVTRNDAWGTAKCLSESRALTSREIISYINKNFGENISSGSYDDIRRKDLLHPFLAGLVCPDKPDANTNNPTRKWALSPDFASLVRAFGSKDWHKEASAFMSTRKPLAERLSARRKLNLTPVTLPSGIEISLGQGEHNLLQKAIIEQFLPRFGHGAEVLYIGDAENKQLFNDKEKAKELGLAELSHKELPDVVAYSSAKNWLFLIEAVHSANPISQERILVLEGYVRNCKYSIVYVTAFLTKEAFRKFATDIAWETEVWIASDPDHMIHFNGDKFLGPYKE